MHLRAPKKKQQRKTLYYISYYDNWKWLRALAQIYNKYEGISCALTTLRRGILLSVNLTVYPTRRRR